MISRETITRIVDTARIDEVVGDFLTLKKRGVNMLANCPFHNEKSPSFTVSPAKGIYKCFGCGASGNSINFVMEHEHYTYPEALRYLAKKYHIEIEETEAPSDMQLEEKNTQDALYIANSFAQKYYSEQLTTTDEGSVGLSYFKERGFTTDTIQKFQLGWAPSGYDTFTKAALAAGYQLDILQKAGLVSVKENRTFDFFRERVQFTIHNFSGKVVGFGGRTLKADKKLPKYVNTQETDIYNKSKILYGLFFAKNAVRKQDECILVEGYTDVISLVQAGIENVAASSGTSLTVEQIRLIKRLTPNITILYDGDAAGIKAALRGIDLVLEEDMNVKIVLLPTEDDPDSFVKREGVTAFLKYKQEKQKDFILFKTDYLLKDAGTDPVKKTEVIRDIIHSVSLVPDTIKRSLYIRECSTLLDMDERILITEINKERGKKLSKTTGIPREEIQQISNEEVIDHPEQERYLPSPLARQEREVIRLLLDYGTEVFEEDTLAAQVIFSELDEPDMAFEDEVPSLIWAEYRAAMTEGRVPEPKDFLNHEDIRISQFAIDLLHPKYELSENWDKMHEIIVSGKTTIIKKDITSTIGRYKLIKLELLAKQNRQDVKEAAAEGNDERMIELLTRQKKLDEARMLLGKVLGTVILPGDQSKAMSRTHVRQTAPATPPPIQQESAAPPMPETLPEPPPEPEEESYGGEEEFF